jgi:hypothetical protein
MVNSKKTRHLPALAAMLASLCAYSVYIYLRETGHPPGDAYRTVTTLLFIVAFATWVFLQVRIYRGLDEFERQVQFLALAIAFPASLVAVFALGLLRAEGFLSSADPRDLPIVMVGAYGVGLALAWRRYR